MAWPAATYETIEAPNPKARMDEWEPETISFKQTIPACIAKQTPTLTEKTNAAVRSATLTLKQLATQVTQNQLNITPALLGNLIRFEAVSSSQIEDIEIDAEQLFLHIEEPFSTDKTNPELTDIELVTHNIEIVSSAIVGSERVTKTWFKSLHTALMTGSAMLPEHIGKWRNCPVWIGRTRAEAFFEGPDHKQIDALMDDLIGFSDRFDLNPIVQAAIAHAQFEIIHPFVDGNGRLGRAFIHPILRRYIPTTAIPTAHALLAMKQDYFTGLTAYKDGDINKWITIFAEAVQKASQASIELATLLTKAQKHWTQLAASHRGAAAKIVQHLLEHPVITVAIAQGYANVTQPTALKALKTLEAEGVLRRAHSAESRAHVWLAKDLVEFFEQAQRNSRQPLSESSY